MEKYSIPHPTIILKDCSSILRCFGRPIPFSVLLHWYNKVTHRELPNESYQYGYQCPQEFLDKSELFVFLFKENVTHIGLSGYSSVPIQDWTHLCYIFENLTLVEEVHQNTVETEIKEDPTIVQKIVEKINISVSTSNDRPPSLYRSHYSITVADPRRP